MPAPAYLWGFTCPACKKDLTQTRIYQEWKQRGQPARFGTSCFSCHITLEVAVVTNPSFGYRTKEAPIEPTHPTP